MKKIKILAVTIGMLFGGSLAMAQSQSQSQSQDPLAKMLESVTRQAPQVQGSQSSVPGNNPFLFCSMPRPSRHSPHRPIYDRICPEGKKNASQVMQQQGITEFQPQADSLTATLGTMNMSSVIGNGSTTSSAGKNSSGSSVANYNKNYYNQIVQEDNARQMEVWKQMNDPEYVQKEIANSKGFTGTATSNGLTYLTGEVGKPTTQVQKGKIDIPIIEQIKKQAGNNASNANNVNPASVFSTNSAFK